MSKSENQITGIDEKKLNMIMEHWVFRLLGMAAALVSITSIILFTIYINPKDQKISYTEAKLEISEKNLLETKALWSKTEKNLKSANTELEKTKEKFIKINNQLGKTDKKLLDTNSKLNHTDERLSETINSLDQSEGKLQLTTKELEKTKNDFIATTEKLIETQSNLNIKKEQLIEITNKLSEREKNLGELSSRIKESSISLNEENTKLKKTSNLLKEKEENLNVVTKKLENTLEKLSLSEKEISSRKEKITSITDSLASVLGDLSKDIKSNSDEYEKLKSGINGLIITLDEKKKELEKYSFKSMIEMEVKEASNKFCDSSEIPFEANVRIDSDGSDNTNVEFFINTKVNFKKGQYNIKEAYQHTCFIKTIGEFIKSIKEQSLEYSTFDIEGKFEGGADTIIKSYVGHYNGEFGTIVADNVLVNGALQNITLYENDKIKNSDLAFLRAYSVFDAFKSINDSNAMQLTRKRIDFIASEHMEEGLESRFGKITVKINRSDKEHISKVIE